jgi:hypothetical protein
METRQEKEIRNWRWCVCRITCESGRSTIGETGRSLAVLLREDRHNLKEGLKEKSKWAQYAYEEGHSVDLDKARILEIESNSRYRKYKESAPYGMFSQSDYPTHFGHFSHLDLPYQQWVYQLTEMTSMMWQKLHGFL